MCEHLLFSMHSREYCIALHCIVLYCIVLYCIVLYCIVQAKEIGDACTQPVLVYQQKSKTTAPAVVGGSKHGD